ncbi:MAG: MBL fold metallo-hydrolase [Oscillospiraceae bacterium]|nr:MBL fold metallo-hydrolase [Oscillospiraceae bacterium]
MKSYFRSRKVTDRLIRIYGATGECMYLAIGDERALLVDTGTGIGDLKGYVSDITDKPLTVAMTHGHVDHVQGVSQFDEYYLSSKDLFLLEINSDMDLRIGYARRMAVPARNPDLAGIQSDGFQPKAEAEKSIDLPDGTVFDLGGVTAEFHALPGHTPGSMAVLFPEEKVLLTGDACCVATLLNFDYSSSIESYRKNLLSLKEKLAGKYDRVVISHGGHEFGDELIESILECCNEVISRTDEAVPMTGPGGRKGFYAHDMDFLHGRRDGKPGNIVYSLDNIYSR